MAYLLIAVCTTMTLWLLYVLYNDDDGGPTAGHPYYD